MTRAVLRTELAVLWSSPLPYLAGAVFHVVFGVLVVDQLDVRSQAVLQPFVPIAGFLVLLAVPVLTMRSFAEEARTGTLDVLLAARVPPRPLVIGKWLAAWLSGLVVVAPLSVAVGLVALWGEPDLGPVVSGALGLVLLTGAVAALGVAASASTSSPPVAVLVATFVVLVSWFAGGASALSTGSGLAAVSLSARLQLFADGAIALRDVAFFGGLAVACLGAACVVVDLRRLR